MRLEPKDANFEFRIRSGFGTQGFMRHVGAYLEVLEPGRCIIAADFHEQLAQRHGYFHGGLIGSLADDAGGYAVCTLIAPEQSVLTVEYKVSFLAPAIGSKLRAVGQVIRFGRSLSVAESKVFALSDSQESLCAVALVTMKAVRREERRHS